MAKASNKKAAISNVHLGMSNNKNLNVRQIENGFIVRESGSVGKGKNQKYFEKEFFSKSNPIAIKTSKLKIGL